MDLLFSRKFMGKQGIVYHLYPHGKLQNMFNPLVRAQIYFRFNMDPNFIYFKKMQNPYPFEAVVNLRR